MRNAFLTLLALPAATLFYLPAMGGEPLSEHTVGGIGVAVEPEYRLAPMGSEGQPAQDFAAVLPEGARDLQVFYIYTTDNSVQYHFAAARIAANQADRGGRAWLGLDSGSGPAAVTLDMGSASPLTGVFLFSPGEAAASGAVVILRYASDTTDSPLQALAIDPDGRVSAVDIGGAKAMEGRMALADIDDDGVFELITHRGLDGFEKGFSYQAVRSYDASTQRFGPAPDKYRKFYEDELAFLDWVVETRAKILEDAEPYLSTADTGWFFTAKYKGKPYGFDSIVTLPDYPDAGGNITAYNLQRENALKRIVEYRDQLRGWLDGGPYPDVWQMDAG